MISNNYIYVETSDGNKKLIYKHRSFHQCTYNNLINILLKKQNLKD